MELELEQDDSFSTLLITLMRHGEASGSPDIERQLTQTGQQQCRTIGQELRSRDLLPDFILCSGVDRTRQSHAALGLNEVPVVFCGEDLYRASSAREVLGIIADHVPATARHPLVIGHNPTIHETVCVLARESDNDELLLQLGRGYPPATASVFEFHSDTWDLLHPSTMNLLDILSAEE